MNKFGGIILLAFAVAACSASSQPNGAGGQGGGASSNATGGSGGVSSTTMSSSGGGSAGCDAASCASGCCAQGMCIDGTADNQCGKGGQACLDCGAVSLVCTDHACAMKPVLCTAQTCPSGCCKNDQCQMGLSDQACGTGGQACKDCSAEGLACVNGLCMQ